MNKKMRQLRLNRGYTQQSLAEKVGVAKPTIHLIEVGKYNPSLKVMKKICNELNATLEYLFSDESYIKD